MTQTQTQDEKQLAEHIKRLEALHSENNPYRAALTELLTLLIKNNKTAGIDTIMTQYDLTYEHHKSGEPDVKMNPHGPAFVID